jgi:hypothetical protein
LSGGADDEHVTGGVEDVGLGVVSSLMPTTRAAWVMSRSMRRRLPPVIRTASMVLGIARI